MWDGHRTSWAEGAVCTGACTRGRSAGSRHRHLCADAAVCCVLFTAFFRQPFVVLFHTAGLQSVRRSTRPWSLEALTGANRSRCTCTCKRHVRCRRLEAESCIEAILFYCVIHKSEFSSWRRPLFVADGIATNASQRTNPNVVSESVFDELYNAVSLDSFQRFPLTDESNMLLQNGYVL